MLFVRVGILRRRIQTCLHIIYTYVPTNIHNGTIIKYTRIIGVLYYTMSSYIMTL